MFFISKQKKVESLLSDYRQQVINCLNLFQRSINEYFEAGDKLQLQQNCAAIHKSESLADDIRREVEVMMYSKGLFPESREDILILLETMDRVPNQAETVMHTISDQQVEIPSQYHHKIANLIDICVRCSIEMLKSSEKLFSDFTTATLILGRVDELESEADVLESVITKKIFESDMDGFSKMMLRDTIQQISSISDRAEKAGDRIRIIVAKRSV